MSPWVNRVGRSLTRIVPMLVITLAVVITLATTIAVFVFHLSIQPVSTRSMEPTYGPGWAVFAHPVPTTQLRDGDIILFRPPGKSVTYAHRVIQITGPRSRPVVRTQGDANPAPDPWHARIIGSSVMVVVATAPHLGTLILDLRNGFGVALASSLVAISICVIGVRRMRKTKPRRQPKHRAKTSARFQNRWVT